MFLLLVDFKISILILGRDIQGIVIENVFHLLLPLYKEDIQMIRQLKIYIYW